MKILFAFILFLSPLLTFSQFDSILLRALEAQDTRIFNTVVDSLEKQSFNHFYIGWKIERELTSGFQERILLIQSYKAGNTVSLKVNLLCTDKNILYYQLYRTKVNSLLFPVDSLLKSDQINSLLEVFEDTFTNAFGGRFNKNELFIDTIVYSKDLDHGCHQATVYRNRISRILNTDNVEELSDLLYSTNVETQLYGVEGFYKLILKGYKLSDEQIRIIKYILRRHGTYRHCEKWVISPSSISDFTEALVF